jgi:hypothetical protein
MRSPVTRSACSPADPLLRPSLKRCRNRRRNSGLRFRNALSFHAGGEDEPFRAMHPYRPAIAFKKLKIQKKRGCGAAPVPSRLR